MSNVVNLSKGNTVNLSKKAPGLSEVMVGLGWDPAEKTATLAGTVGFLGKLFGKKEGAVTRRSDTIDCDASALLLVNSRVADQRDLVYFGQKNHKSGAIIHQGDNLTGEDEGKGDDEQIMINLGSVPGEYNEIVLFVNIYNARSKGQNFGQLSNTYIRLVNQKNNEEMCRYDISNSAEYAEATAVIFGKLVRNGSGEWEFKALGEASKAADVSAIVRKYT